MVRTQYVVWGGLALLCLLLAAHVQEAAEMNRAYLWLLRPAAGSAQPPALADSARGAEAAGHVAAALGADALAVGAFTRALALGRDTALVHWYLAEALRRTGDVSGAIVQYRAARAAPYFLQEGLTLRHHKDWPGAEQALRMALAITPDDAELNSVVGQFYWEWGRHSEAGAFWSAAAALETRAYERGLRLGEVALSVGDDGAALQALQSLMAQQPTRPEAYRRLAETLVFRGERAEAVSVLQSGLARAAPNYGLCLQLAQLYELAGDYAEAERVLELAGRIDPHSDEAWLLRGQNAMARLRMDEAVQDFQRALQIDPENPETRAWLERVQALTPQ